MVFSAIGIYSANNVSFDVYLTAIFGILGIVWRLLGCSPVPMLLGFVLGPMVEENLRRALQVSDGDPFGVLHAADQPCVHRRHGPDPDRDGAARRAQTAGRHYRLMRRIKPVTVKNDLRTAGYPSEQEGRHISEKEAILLAKIF